MAAVLFSPPFPPPFPHHFPHHFPPTIFPRHLQGHLGRCVDSEGALVNAAHVLAPGDALTRAWCDSRPNITTSAYFAANNITVPPEQHYQVRTGRRKTSLSQKQLPAHMYASTRTPWPHPPCTCRLPSCNAATHARTHQQPVRFYLPLFLQLLPVAPRPAPMSHSPSHHAPPTPPTSPRRSWTASGSRPLPTLTM
jgi:hypothetical protein